MVGQVEPADVTQTLLGTTVEIHVAPDLPEPQVNETPPVRLVPPETTKTPSIRGTRPVRDPETALFIRQPTRKALAIFYNALFVYFY